MRPESGLVWAKHSKNGWHRLADLDLEALDAYGVYVVWHGGYPSRVVSVGFGSLATELSALSNHESAALYAQTGPLYVTWAAADPSSAPGICRHLADKLRPLVADDASRAAPIVANSPF